MEYIIQMIISFIATACFGVIFNVPTKRLIHCGLIGSIGWVTYYVLSTHQVDEVRSSFVGAFVVALLAQIFAKRYRMPMIIFSVSGIIPLVPGSIAYNTMRNIVELDYNLGLHNGLRVLMISGAIAMGLVFAEVMLQIVLRVMNRGKTSIQAFFKIKKPR